MKRICQRIQDVVALEGPQSLRNDDNAQRHLTECDSCYACLEAFARLDGLIAALPVIDAPDDVVEALLGRPELATAGRASRRAAFPTFVALYRRLQPWLRIEKGRRPGPLAWGSGAAAALLLIVALGSLSDVLLTGDIRRMGPEQPLVVRKLDPPSTVVEDQVIRDLEQLGYVSESLTQVPAATPDEPEPRLQAETESSSRADESFSYEEGQRGRELREKNKASRSAKIATNQMWAESSPGDLDAYVRRQPGKPLPAPPVGQYRADYETSYFSDEFIQALPVPGRYYQNVLELEPGVQDPDGDGRAEDRSAGSRDFKARVSGVSNVDPLSGEDAKAGSPDARDKTENTPSGTDSPVTRESGASTTNRPSPALVNARRFLAERASLEGLDFAEPTGYWRNAYVPGDPGLRFLQARLAQADPAILGPAARPEFRLHQAVRRTAQPFDLPADSALAVYLQTDRRGLNDPGRMLVQVGLEAAERHGGRRPAMNLAVVLDLSGGIAEDTAVASRTLITALGRAKEPGDRFRLIVAGPAGGLLVAPDDFNYGYLTVTLDRLLGGDPGIDAEALPLVAAVKTAIEQIAGADDPNAPLGTSAVMLATPHSLGSAIEPLVEMAHQSAVAGIPLSVVGIGHAIQLDEIDRLTLAGQGSRRLLASPAEAAGLIDRELASVSRAIARAVRLRIRLAPGVKLVNVLGSERLDAARAQRVRDAERSVDLRLERNLGIHADRGEDEDGVQIVIPSFYSGDSHVILLDVVAPGPGPIADVVVRYKDLVYLRNGVARAALSLDDDERAPGTLQRNVLKNLLALRLSENLQQAGTLLRQGDRAHATELLTDVHELLTGLCTELPDLGGDAELNHDIRLLSDYRALLDDGAIDRPEQLTYLSNSLLYAGRLRVLAPLALN